MHASAAGTWICCCDKHKEGAELSWAQACPQEPRLATCDICPGAEQGKTLKAGTEQLLGEAGWEPPRSRATRTSHFLLLLEKPCEQRCIFTATSPMEVDTGGVAQATMVALFLLPLVTPATTTAPARAQMLLGFVFPGHLESSQKTAGQGVTGASII